MTIVFMPMLVGLGDHSIHFIARFEEERAAGRSLRAALVRTFGGTGMGIVAAAGTTAFAFSMLLLTGFRGQKDGRLPVEYRLSSLDGRWTVVDVVVDGVSLAANYRAQFSKIILDG